MADKMISHDLSVREFEVLKEIVQGKTNQTIAQGLYICEKTVEFHIRNIYYKLNVRNRIEAVLWFVNNIKN